MEGWRARLGFMVPPGTPTVEREMSTWVPRGVSTHFARMVASGPVGTLANLRSRAASQLEHMDATVDSIAAVEPDVIVLAHTATSYVLGRAGDAELARRQRERTGVPFVSALGSAAAALEVLGVRRIAIGTPYDEALTQRSQTVFEEFGIEVVHAECLPDVKNIFEETARRVYGLIRRVDRAGAQALFVSGVGLPTLDVLGAAEEDFGKPVLSSACAMLWNALRAAGVRAPITGAGRLLADPRYRAPSADR